MQVQGNLARLLYIHPPIATVALYWAGGVALAGSLFYLWPRTRSFFWDRLAASAVEVGAVFSALTCVTGSIWGRPAWGVWWAWDARLTSTALLLLLELGYLALRRVPADPAVRARRCAVAALLIALDVPIVHFSVEWWQTLHQTGTVLDPGFHLHVHGSMAWTFLLGFISFSLIFVWLLGVRYRIEVLQDTGGRPGDGGVPGRTVERGRDEPRRCRAPAATPGRGHPVSYVDAGYTIALATLFIYGVGLVLRRRRWERALKVAEDAPETMALAPGRDQHHQRPGYPVPLTGSPSTGAASTARPASWTEDRRCPGPDAGASRRLWLVFAVLLAAFVFLLVEGLGSSLNYLRHGQPGLRPPQHLGHENLQSRG